MPASLWSRVSSFFGSTVPVAPVIPPKRVRKVDGFVNELMGIGTDRDKIAAGFFAAEMPLSDTELSAAFYHNDIARKIVAKLPEEMFRRGWDLEGEEKTEELEQIGTDLRLEGALFKALVWARLFGGAAVILGVDDGGMPWEPLVVERSRGVKFLNVIDRRRLTAWATYQNPLEPKYGEISHYLVQPDLFGRAPNDNSAAPSAIIHESRLIRFDGDELIDLQQRTRLNGWSFSTLQAPYRIVQQFATAFEAAGFLISDASQGVFKMQGLIDMIAGGEEGTLQTRMALVDMMRHAGRAVMLDAEGEDFTRVSTPLSGVPELLDRLMLRLASAADMPVSILFGREPAGLNATGDADTRAWYATVASKQEKILEPAIKRFYEVATAGAKKIDVCFKPLWEPTDKEKAEIEKLEADTDKVRIDSGVVFAEQVALERYGDIPIEETIDTAALEKSLKAEYELAAEGPKDPLAAMPPGGGVPAAVPKATPPAAKADAAEAPFAQRNAAFLADLKDHRDLGLEADIPLLAKLHNVPIPKGN